MLHLHYRMDRSRKANLLSSSIASRLGWWIQCRAHQRWHQINLTKDAKTQRKPSAFRARAIYPVTLRRASLGIVT